ncbi:MAG: DUF3000 family protein [Actinomycetota bacterium]
MHSVPQPHEAFEARVRPLLDVPIRPEFSIEQAPSPQRLAPQAFTLTADAVTDGSSASVGAHVESASGRFVVLHDPDGVDEWEGNDRIVIFARCDVEPELLADPLIHEVAWSWVTEALDNHEVAQLGGTVTVSSGTSFGSMAERPGDGLVEIRASWTPLDDDLTDHLALWIEILATLAGLPPVSAGVATVGGRRATHT